MEEIANITPRGLGEDYRKSFGPLNLFLRSIYAETETKRIRKFAEERFTRQKYHFYKYTDWFPEGEFADVVNDKNRESIQQLDSIVARLNDLVDNGKLTELPTNGSQHEALQLYNEAMRLIMGWENFDFKKVLEKGEINKYFSA